MLKKFTDMERLDEVKATIYLLKIRFPVAVIHEKTGINKGNLSAYLNGKKPISDTFYDTFFRAFADDIEQAKKKRCQYKALSPSL